MLKHLGAIAAAVGAKRLLMLSIHPAEATGY
jgi:hypothetical protein